MEFSRSKLAKGRKEWEERIEDSREDSSLPPLPPQTTLRQPNPRTRLQMQALREQETRTAINSQGDAAGNLQQFNRWPMYPTTPTYDVLPSRDLPSQTVQWNVRPTGNSETSVRLERVRNPPATLPPRQVDQTLRSQLIGQHTENGLTYRAAQVEVAGPSQRRRTVTTQERRVPQTYPNLNIITPGEINNSIAPPPQLIMSTPPSHTRTSIAFNSQPPFQQRNNQPILQSYNNIPLQSSIYTPTSQSWTNHPTTLRNNLSQTPIFAPSTQPSNNQQTSQQLIFQPTQNQPSPHQLISQPIPHPTNNLPTSQQLIFQPTPQAINHQPTSQQLIYQPTAQPNNNQSNLQPLVYPPISQQKNNFLKPQPNNNSSTSQQNTNMPSSQPLVGPTISHPMNSQPPSQSNNNPQPRTISNSQPRQQPRKDTRKTGKYEDLYEAENPNPQSPPRNRFDMEGPRRNLGYIDHFPYLDERNFYRNHYRPYPEIEYRNCIEYHPDPREPMYPVPQKRFYDPYQGLHPAAINYNYRMMSPPQPYPGMMGYGQQQLQRMGPNVQSGPVQPYRFFSLPMPAQPQPFGQGFSPNDYLVLDQSPIQTSEQQQPVTTLLSPLYVQLGYVSQSQQAGTLPQKYVLENGSHQAMARAGQLITVTQQPQPQPQPQPPELGLIPGSQQQQPSPNPSEHEEGPANPPQSPSTQAVPVLTSLVTSSTAYEDSSGSSSPELVEMTEEDAEAFKGSSFL